MYESKWRSITQSVGHTYKRILKENIEMSIRDGRVRVLTQPRLETATK